MGVGVYSQSLCMSSSQNGNVSCYGLVPGGCGCRLHSYPGGRFFNLFAFFENVRNAPGAILKALNSSATWKIEGDGQRTRSTEDSFDGVPLVRAEMFNIVSDYAKLTRPHFPNVTCLRHVSELPGN